MPARRWYADTYADELDESCIAHLNIDSPGCRDATAYEEVMWMAEASTLCTGAIADALGEQAGGMRPLRAGDYSFNQIGPTAFYMLLSNIPIAERKRRGYYAVGGNGGSPTWHTPNDLPPVADLAILRRDLAVYLTTIVRVVNAPLYPFDYAAAVDEIAKAVEGYQARVDGQVDLRPILGDLDALKAALARWRAEAERARHLGRRGVAPRCQRRAAPARARAGPDQLRARRALRPRPGDQAAGRPASRGGRPSGRRARGPAAVHPHRARSRAQQDSRDAARRAARAGGVPMRSFTLAGVAVMLAALAAPLDAGQAPKTATPVKTLEPSPSTVAYGYYDAAAKPVMRIKSGDTVRIHTLITSTPERLEGAGVAKDQVEPELRDDRRSGHRQRARRPYPDRADLRRGRRAG